jgi:hypothetical protein
MCNHALEGSAFINAKPVMSLKIVLPNLPGKNFCRTFLSIPKEASLEEKPEDSRNDSEQRENRRWERDTPKCAP